MLWKMGFSAAKILPYPRVRLKFERALALSSSPTGFRQSGAVVRHAHYGIDGAALRMLRHEEIHLGSAPVNPPHRAASGKRTKIRSRPETYSAPISPPIFSTSMWAMESPSPVEPLAVSTV